MAIVRYSRADASARVASPDEFALVDSLSVEQIEANALSDPDNPPMTEAELACAVAGREVRRIRQATGLSQEAFAARYRIAPEQVRDWEAGRVRPDAVARSYLAVIACEPEAVIRALTAAE